MYPFLRLAYHTLKTRRMKRLSFQDTHECTVRIQPQDIDIFNELNNGRILTLFDLGRLPFGYRVGLMEVMKRKKWGMTMAGASVRYRKRVHLFQKVRITTTAVGRDERFFYIIQTMWAGSEATSNIVYRAAMTDKKGIVPTDEFVEEMGIPDWNPPMPDWVKNWIGAEATRDWPPEL
jgi:acyl-CoA thioesterase FadM